MKSTVSTVPWSLEGGTMNGVAATADCSAEVALIADELGRAVELTLNPAIDHTARTHAYNACESFKENSPLCAQAGLMLASSPQYSAVVKHFGLQLMETTVKYRWTHISQAEKIFIKENAMKLLWVGGWEQTHLNDALARLIVEMVKREWPQQWPTLLAELSDACARGHRHTQIVLHIFLRLVEDVATLQTLEQNQRRKDIYQALTGNMAEIFAFFMRLVELHVGEFREKTAAGDFVDATSNGRVVQVALLTLTGFVEWVSMSHVVANNGRLLQMLCILLQDDSFQLPAAECLLQIVNRKGPTKERKPLMMLFSEDHISCIHRAASAAIRQVEENSYLFLKKLAQVLAGLGQQLVSLWSAGGGAAGGAGAEDAWLPLLLETLLRLTSHASLTLAHTVNSVWVAFMKHEHISRLPRLLATVPRLLHAMSPKMIKVPYPSSRPRAVTLDTTAYACIDYDSEKEFTAFYCRCRTDILDCYKHCMMVAPLVTWSYVEQFTRAALDQPSIVSVGDLDTQHPLYLEWEALSMVLEVVLSRVLMVEPRPNVAEGLSLLDRCVSCCPASPHLLSLLLSFISALFVFLSMASCQLAGANAGSMGAELLPRVLDKIFGALVYTDGTSDGRPRSRPVKNVRRHAASLLVKLGHKYPLLLLPVLGRLHGAARAVLARTDLSTLESVTLQEALLLVSNHLCSYERQSALVAEVLGDCAERWASMGPHVSCAAGLARLIGLHEPPTEAEDEHWRARRQLLHALTLLLGVVKRTMVPDDPDKASRGGFSGGVTAQGNPVWRNPCAAHVLPLLPHVLSLARSLHELHAPAAASLRHKRLAAALCLPLPEQHNLLGLRDLPLPPVTPPHTRMQSFIYSLHDNVCHVVGAAAATLGRELYSMSGLGAALAGSILHGLHDLPDYRLKTLVRVALRPLIHHCPPAHYTQLAIPILQHFAPFMLSHLSRRWEYLNSLSEAREVDEEGGSDQQEILEDMISRSLTREYLELLKAALVGGALCEAPPGDMEEDSPSPAAQRAPEHVSELGALVLADPVAGPAALHTLLCALTWNDSTSSLRASALAGPALRAALAAERVSAADAGRALAAVLQALSTHGQHDANQASLLALAVQTYEALRPRHPSVAQVLRAIPGVDAQDVSRLDDKLVAAPSARPGKVDKSKRDLFKKITNQLIGRNVGQLFRKEVFIVDLPTMHSAKEKPLGTVESGESTGLEGLFSSPPLT